MYDPSLIQRYALPKLISKGLGWTMEGTVLLGSTKAYLSEGVPMPENNGKIYAWGSVEDTVGGHYVVEVGAIDTGRILLSSEAFDVDHRLVLTHSAIELIAVQQASTIILPVDSILSTFFGSGCGRFIAVADQISKTYITGLSGYRFSHLEGEGMLLDNVTISYYTLEAVLLSHAVGQSVLTHLENVICDDRSIDSVTVTSEYTGTLTLLNNTLDCLLEITSLNPSAVLTVRNNRIAEIVVYGATDYTNLIRNNYIGAGTVAGGATLPLTEKEGTHWHTLNTLEEMEGYRGNILGNAVTPSRYGYYPSYGKTGIGVNGGVPYLLPLEKISWSRFSDTVYNISWEKKQSELSNSYRIALSEDIELFPTFAPVYIDAGDVSNKVLESGKTLLDAYSDTNDGNHDGYLDPLLDLRLNTVWYLTIFAQVKLGEKLLVHLSAPSIVIAVPVRETGFKAPEYSVGLAFPVQIKNGAFVLAEKSDSIKASLYNIIMTNPGERLLHANGAGLRAFLFEGNIDASLLDVAREHIRSEIEALEPRVKIQAVYLRDMETTHGRAILVNIVYINLESGEPDNFSIGLGNYGTNQQSV